MNLLTGVTGLVSVVNCSAVRLSPTPRICLVSSIISVIVFCHADVTMDEGEKKVVSNTYSEVLLVYHLDSKILAQLCD